MKKTLIVAMIALSLFFGACKNRSQPVWILKLKSRSYTQPIIHQGRFLVFSQAGEAICGDVRSGTILWKQVLPAPILGDPAVADDGTLFVVTQNGLFYAMDVRTGSTKWRIELHDSFIAPLTIFGPSILLPSERGILYVRSRRDGSEMWKFSGAIKFNAAAVVFSDYILIGGWSRDFYCLKQDGSLNWKFRAADRITNPAIASGNFVYFPAYDQFIYSLEIPSGRLKWRYPARSPSNLILWKDRIFFGAEKSLVSLSTRSGKLMGSRVFGKTIDRLYLHPPNLLVLSSYGYRVNPELTETSLVLRGLQPIFKLSSGEGMILASDDLYSIYGYDGSIH